LTRYLNKTESVGLRKA